ncbi:MAG TPA: enoyl-CoA hydratase-related protein [Alphaproteobacteria bacterium]|nr:enoyl-CoA hydratase-related protein [Alphaproteobacteria bacterium]
MSALPDCETLALSRDGGRVHLTFNRPDVRNAMNNRMGEEFNAVLEALERDRTVRAIVLRGAGGHFSAGADIKERRQQAEETAPPGSDPLAERNARGGRMFLKLNAMPQVVIAAVEGAALGGGFGIACVADVTLVTRDARLGMPETTIGVAPAQIAPFVVKRIGLTQARRLALTGARIDGAEAWRLGIAHDLCDDTAALEARLEEVLQAVERCGPEANAVTKEIMLAVGSMPDEEMVQFSAARFAALNRSAEGLEGQRAFIEKRAPDWVPPRRRGDA